MSGYSPDEIEAWKEEDEQTLSYIIDRENEEIAKAKSAGWKHIVYDRGLREWVGTNPAGVANTILKMKI